MSGNHNKPHCLYVVSFCDNRLKVGISSNVKQRMKYYKQEATRNRVDQLTWWACSNFRDKETALHAERVMCRTYSEFAIKGHREWFYGELKGFKALMETAEQIRALLGDEIGDAKKDLPFRGAHGHFSGLAQ